MSSQTNINGCPPSSACLIDDTTSFILLGGWQSETVTGAHTRVTRYSTVQYSTVQYTRLTRYNLHGFVEDLPRLNIQRYNSGCSHYNSDGKKVESII